MGQSSSQLEPPSTQHVDIDIEDDRSEAASQASTTPSQGLAHELEKSVMESAQKNGYGQSQGEESDETTPVSKSRKKSSRAAELRSAAKMESTNKRKSDSPTSDIIVESTPSDQEEPTRKKRKASAKTELTSEPSAPAVDGAKKAKSEKKKRKKMPAEAGGDTESAENALEAEAKAAKTLNGEYLVLVPVITSDRAKVTDAPLSPQEHAEKTPDDTTQPAVLEPDEQPRKRKRAAKVKEVPQAREEDDEMATEGIAQLVAEGAKPAKKRKRAADVETAPQPEESVIEKTAEDAGQPLTAGRLKGAGRKRNRASHAGEQAEDQPTLSIKVEPLDDANESSGMAALDEADINTSAPMRSLTASDLEKEIEPEIDSTNKSDKSERIAVRNDLRDQLLRHEEIDGFNQGKIKRKTHSDGTPYLKYAKPGKHFKVPRRTVQEEDEVEANLQTIKEIKHALLVSLVAEESSANMESSQRKVDGSESAAAPMQARAVEDIRDVKIQLGGVPTPPESADAEDEVASEKGSTSRDHDIPSDPPHLIESVLEAERESLAPEDSNSVSSAERVSAKKNRASQSKQKKNTGTSEVTTKANKRKASQSRQEQDTSTGEVATKAVKKKASQSSQKQDTDESTAQAGKNRSNAAPTPIPAEGIVKGAFTIEEKETADRIFDEIVREGKITDRQLCSRIENWKSCGTFKEDMYIAFPHRTKDAIRKFCQRRFHNFNRGAWTEEQDEALRSAYSRHPGAWVKISEYVERNAGDCKDRWNHHLQQRHQVTGPWSVKEENDLLSAVEECIDVIKRENRADTALQRDRERLEALISWRIVAEKLSGKRSLKRCREKYALLKARKAKDDNAMAGIGRSSTARTNQYSSSSGHRDRSPDRESEKYKVAKRVLEGSFEVGDFYDVLVEIHTAFPDHSEQFHDAGNVLWAQVGTKAIGSRFSLFHSPGALRRAAFDKAVEEWPASDAKMKKRIDKADTVPAKAFLLCKWMEKKHEGRVHELKRTFEADWIGREVEIVELKKEMKREAINKTAIKNNEMLSNEYVADSDDDNEHKADSDQEDHAVAEESASGDDYGAEVHVKGEPVSDDEESPSPMQSPGEPQPDTKERSSLAPGTLRKPTTPKLSSGDFVKRCTTGSGRRRTEQYGKRAAAQRAKRQNLEH